VAPAALPVAATPHLAAAGRVLPADEPAEQGKPASGTGAPPSVEPDLDSLARQVYTVLRRRLAAEIRQSR
jgi:hypothetical protein